MSLPEGYEIPVARALTERVTMMGLPRNIALTELSLIMCMFFAVGPTRMLVWLVPFAALLHWGLVTLYMRDAYAGELWLIYAKQPDRLEV